jgi:hypothetical protein
LYWSSVPRCFGALAEQVVDEDEDENYDIGAVAMQGWRTEMVSPAHSK